MLCDLKICRLTVLILTTSQTLGPTLAEQFQNIVLDCTVLLIAYIQNQWLFIQKYTSLERF